MGSRGKRAALGVVLAGAAALAFVRADGVRTIAIRNAAADARVLAQTRLAPLFQEADLSSPISGNRYASVAGAVKRSVEDKTDIDHVIVWSEVGRVIYADDQGLVGTRPSYIRDFVYAVANGTTQTKVEAGSLKTFTPIWRQPGGTVAVAELDQPFGPVAGATGRMLTLAALALGLGSLTCWVLFAMTWRSGPASAPVRPAAVRPARVAPNGAQALGPVMAAAPPSVVRRVAEQTKTAAGPDPGVREAERAKSEAEQRARSAEDRLSRLQLQHKQAMERLQALEDRLSIAAAAPKQAQEELRALRDQVRESAERLHTAETENEQLRARLNAPHLPGVVGAGGNAR